MDIYWIKDKRQCGPATVPDVISQLQMGELTPETLGWHAGCPRWQALKDLPALADFLNKKESAPAAEEPPAPAELSAPVAPTPAEESPALPPAPVPLPGSDATPQVPEALQRVYLPGPAARLLARLVDYGLYALVFYGILYLRHVPYDAALLLSVNPLLWLPMVAIEASLLSTWGTTPGKALMGIHVTTFGDTPRLSYLRAFLRSLMVFTLGMGVMMPQLLLIMLVFEYWMLRRRGITPWDARCSTLPTLRAPIMPSRYVLAVITLYICAVISASCMQPWFPAMVADIEKESPELARTLRQYVPETPASEQTASPATPAAPAAPAEPEPQDTSLPGI